MVALRDFSGFVSLPWALARAAAMAPMVSLLRCIGQLRVHEVKADSTGFGALGAQAMPGGLFGILGHQLLQVGLGALVLLIGRAGAAVGGGELRPAVGGTHVNDPDRFQSWSWRLDTEQARRLAVPDAAPELLLCGQKEMLVQRIGMDREFDPLPSPRDDRQNGRPGIGDPHIVLKLRHVLFGSRFFGERPWQHKLGLKYRAARINQAVQRCRHPFDDRMLDPALYVLDGLTGVALIPAPIEVFRDSPKLD